MTDDLNWEWYTKYIHLYGGGWAAQATATDEQGRLHKKAISNGLRMTEKEAIQDGDASGYPRSEENINDTSERLNSQIL